MPTLASIVKRNIHSQEFLFWPKVQAFFKMKNSKLKIVQIQLLEWLLASLAFSLLGFTAMLIFSPIIINLIDPMSKFPDAIIYVRFLALSMIPMAPLILFSYVGIFFDFERMQLKSAIFSLVIAITLYLTLIPSLGGIGAALATFSFYMFDVIYKFQFLFRNMNAKVQSTLSNSNHPLR